MQFIPNARESFVPVRLIEGSLNYFDGKKLSVSYGDKSPLSRRKLILQLRKVISLAKQNKVKNITISWRDIRAIAGGEMSDFELGRLVGTSMVMANYEHNT